MRNIRSPRGEFGPSATPDTGGHEAPACRRLLIRLGRPASSLLLFLALVPLLAGCGGSTSAAQPFIFSTPAPTATPTATPPPPPVSYVAIGASDALGVGADDPATQGYVPLLIAHLPKDSVALNVGVSGILLQDALQAEVPAAIAFNPTLITVWLVGNDFRACTPLTQYAADLGTLLGQLRQKTHARVFVANAPDMSLLPYFSQDHGAGGGACVAGASKAEVHSLVLQWNTVIDPIVLHYGDVLVDLYNTDLASHPSYVSSDGFHPSSEGYVQLADLFWSSITAHHAVPN